MAEEIGGISASIAVDTSEILPGMAAARAAIDQLETKLVSTGNIAATATTKIDAGMRSAAKGSSGFGYQLQVLGQGLDDLQYVGEQGLRPIINNLMQIHPAIGIAAIAIDQFRKNGDDMVDTLKSIAEFAGFDFSADGGVEAFDKLQSSAADFLDYLKKIPGAWGEISGSTQRAEQASIDAFTSQTTKEDKARGQDLVESIARYGPREFLDEMTDPSLLAGNNDDLLRQEQASLIALVARAKKGEPEAIRELEERTAGTGGGDAIREGSSEMKARRKEEAGLEKKRREMETKAYEEALDAKIEGRQELTPEEDASLSGKQREARAKLREKDLKESDADYDAFLERKIEAGEGLTDAERATAPTKLVEKEAELAAKDAKDAEKRLNLEERGADLNWKLRRLMNPVAEGKSLGLEQYEQSHRSQTGDKQLEKLHAIWEAQKEIAANTRKYNLIGVKKR